MCFPFLPVQYNMIQIIVSFLSLQCTRTYFNPIGLHPIFLLLFLPMITRHHKKYEQRFLYLTCGYLYQYRTFFTTSEVNNTEMDI